MVFELLFCCCKGDISVDGVFEDVDNNINIDGFMRMDICGVRDKDGVVIC